MGLLPARAAAAAGHGDTTSGTLENIVALENAGIRAHVPLPDFDHRTPLFGKGAFVYDAEADAYRCPGDQPQSFFKHRHTERVWVYQAAAGTCDARSLKARCTDSIQGRQMKRCFDRV